MAAEHRSLIILINRHLVSESVQIVNTVIHPNTHHNRRNSDGHNIERNARQSHQPEHQACGKNIGRQRQQRD